MRLVTPYAPTSFILPCILVSTISIEGGIRETAVLFREALNGDHALAFASDEVGRVEEVLGRKVQSEWVVIKKHDSHDEAVQYHLDTVSTLVNGGTEEQWAGGMKKYHELYKKHCPKELQERWQMK